MDNTYKKRIFIIEDDEDISKLLKFHLEKEGYKIDISNNGENIKKKLLTFKPDLITLDLMIPGSDGFEICKSLKSDAQTAYIPIIMITGKDEESTIVAGLELGADDFITKPFNIPILIARVRKLLRKKPSHETNKIMRFNELTINSTTHEIKINNELIHANTTEFNLLNKIANKPSWVFSRIQLIDAIRGDGYIVTDRIIDVIIVSLRKKLKDYGSYIQTIRGIGYRFKVPE